MKKSFALTIFLLIIFMASNVFAANVSMEIVEDNICTIKLNDSSTFEKKIVASDLTNHQVTLQLKIDNSSEVIIEGEVFNLGYSDNDISKKNNVSILGNEFDYKIRRISPDGGLSINGQRDVCQDKWGFIWVTTVNNLYRFDGYSFDFYTNRINKSDSYRSITFERLEVDKVGDLYVTTSEGLLKYNTLTDSLDCVFPERCFLIKEDIKVC